MTHRTVTLVPVSREEGVLLGNLLELYIHDLSAIFVDVELGADGRRHDEAPLVGATQPLAAAQPFTEPPQLVD